jgi:DNA-binding beta-propeller fold protein YncE
MKTVLKALGAASVLTLVVAGSTAMAADAPKFYQIQSTLNLGGTGTSWDHIDYDQSHHRLYLSRRADGLTVIDTTTGAVVGQVENAKGSGAVAFNLKADRGYTANTDGSTSIFKLSDLSAVDRITTFGDNFDGVVFDEGTNLLAYQQADNKKELLVDATSMKLVGTIETDGEQLERPVVDGKGSLYLPLRDKHSVYKIDLKEKKVTAHWDLSAKCTEPSGSEFDRANNRLLLPCRGKRMNPVLAVIDADTGAVTSTNPIGTGADEVILDPGSKQVFVTAGVEGNMQVFKQEGADKYTLTEAIQTRPGMRVARFDAETQKIYSMTADGIFDASKKNLAAISPFYANTYVPGSFIMLTYGRGPAAK